MVVFIFPVPVCFAAKQLFTCPDASTLYISQAEEEARILSSIFLI